MYFPIRHLSRKTTSQDFKGIVLKLGFMIVSCILNICSTLPHHQTVFTNVKQNVFSLSSNVLYPAVAYLPLVWSVLLWAFEFIEFVEKEIWLAVWEQQCVLISCSYKWNYQMFVSGKQISLNAFISVMWLNIFHRAIQWPSGDVGG